MTDPINPYLARLVKPLVWEERPTASMGHWSEYGADNKRWRYSIYQNKATNCYFKVALYGTILDIFFTLEDAKAAAQADHTNRIVESLDLAVIDKLISQSKGATE